MADSGEHELKELVLDCVRYWERKRIIYNAVLVMLVIVCWGRDLITQVPATVFAWSGVMLILIFFASIANVLYCAAYPVDLVLQLTPLRAIWLRSRWVLFAIGTSLASALALWVMLHDGMA